MALICWVVGADEDVLQALQWFHASLLVWNLLHMAGLSGLQPPSLSMSVCLSVWAKRD